MLRVVHVLWSFPTNGGQRPINSSNDVCNRDGISGSMESITAISTTFALQDAGISEIAKNHFQKLVRDLLCVGNVICVNQGLSCLGSRSKFEDSSDCVVRLCRDVHGVIEPLPPFRPRDRPTVLRQPSGASAAGKQLRGPARAVPGWPWTPNSHRDVLSQW